MECAVQERLWVFDFDGTLSPLVPDREAAQLSADGKRMLERLVSLPHQKVAVLSSRSLEDLIARVAVPGVWLGGGSGMEWRMPNGRRVLPEDAWAERLAEKRGALLSDLQVLAALPGVELEDKKWSVALHTRSATPARKEELYARVVAWKAAGVRIFSGPEVLEVQMIPEVDKALGLRTLCRIVAFDPSGGNLVYAGDDENDAVAMRWVMYLGGVALMVGTAYPVAGARIVGDQRALAAAVEELSGIDGRRGR